MSAQSLPADGPGAPGRREQRKAATRARLLAAARSLFVARGYDATRPQDIARLADVAAGTFYVHFADKADAFVAFTEQAAGELMDRVREAVSGSRDFEERLYDSLDALLRYSDANPGVIGAAFADAAVLSAGMPRGASLRDRLARSLSQGLRQGMADGSLRADFEPDLLASGIVGLVQSTLTHGAERGAVRERVLRDITRFCSHGLMPDPAEAAARPAEAAARPAEAAARPAEAAARPAEAGTGGRS